MFRNTKNKKLKGKQAIVGRQMKIKPLVEVINERTVF